MIAGIGVDLVEVKRIAQMHRRYGARMESRLLSAAERAQLPAADECRRRRIATSFAAKEAFAKALRIGLRPPATLAAIQIMRDDQGAPSYRFDDQLAALLDKRAIGQCHLAISDTEDAVVAVAVLEKS